MEPQNEHSKLANYILRWLVNRNGGELQPAIENMKLGDYILMKAELELILKCGGHPPNWVPEQ